MATAKRIKLKPTDGGCYQVWFQSKMGNSPIGRICPVANGWTYYSYPVLHVERGPKRTKAAAVKEVVKSHAIYVGYKLGYATKYRGRRSPSKRTAPKRTKPSRSTKKRHLQRMRMALRLRGHGIMRRGRVADISQHKLRFGSDLPIAGVTYRVELANRIEGGRAVGNLYGVARYVDGRRNTYVLPPQRSESVADAVRDALAKGKLADKEAADVLAYVRGIR